MNSIGFTGSQRGMTEWQRSAFVNLIKDLEGEFHHGDCVGSDTQAHMIVLNYSLLKIHIHPPVNSYKSAFCKGYAVIYDPLPYLQRNWQIAMKADHLSATPKEYREELRSGTWATVRYARKLGKKVTIILPNGEMR